VGIRAGEIPKTYCNLRIARLSVLGQVRGFGSELLAAAFRYRYKYKKPSFVTRLNCLQQRFAIALKYQNPRFCNTSQMPILSLKKWSRILTQWRYKNQGEIQNKTGIFYNK
jgi:hypothetical protein